MFPQHLDLRLCTQNITRKFDRGCANCGRSLPNVALLHLSIEYFLEEETVKNRNYHYDEVETAVDGAKYLVKNFEFLNHSFIAANWQLLLRTFRSKSCWFLVLVVKFYVGVILIDWTLFAARSILRNIVYLHARSMASVYRNTQLEIPLVKPRPLKRSYQKTRRLCCPSA